LIDLIQLKRWWRKIIDRPYPVEKIVERIVEKPVEKIIYVDKPVHIERPIERPVEKVIYVDKPITVEKVVYVDRPMIQEKIVERIVEKPTIQEKIIEKIIDRPVPVIQEKVIEKFIDRPVAIIQEKLVYEKLRPNEYKESIHTIQQANIRPPEIHERIGNIREGEKRVIGENIFWGEQRPLGPTEIRDRQTYNRPSGALKDRTQYQTVFEQQPQQIPILRKSAMLYEEREKQSLRPIQQQQRFNDNKYEVKSELVEEDRIFPEEWDIKDGTYDKVRVSGGLQERRLSHRF